MNVNLIHNFKEEVEKIVLAIVGKGKIEVAAPELTLTDKLKEEIKSIVLDVVTDLGLDAPKAAKSEPVMTKAAAIEAAASQVAAAGTESVKGAAQ